MHYKELITKLELWKGLLSISGKNTKQKVRELIDEEIEKLKRQV